MKRALLLALIVAVVLPSLAQKKKKSELPMQVVAAQFVYITSFHGDTYSRETTMEERAAMNRIEDAVRAWGKYKVVYRPEEADLMLIVKTSGLGGARTGIDVGTPPMDPSHPGTRIDPRTGGVGIGTLGGVDVSSDSNDMLLVSITPQEPATDASFVWRRSAHNGLRGNKPTLFEAFRDAVDQTARQNAKP
ncbi:MAG: hypothetical protein ACRD3E_15100 [Terriglobales bacterium]